MTRPPPPAASRTLLGMFCIPLLLSTTGAFGAQLTIVVDNIESPDGQLMVAVLDSELAFAGQAPAVLSVLMPPQLGQVSFSTDALPAGEYAVRVMQDENGNGDMDENMVGMPTEPWGFSNNAIGNFGPPGWTDISFKLDDEASISIKLNH